LANITTSRPEREIRPTLGKFHEASAPPSGQPTFEHADHASGGDTGRTGEAELPQFISDDLRRPRLAVAEVGIAVKVTEIATTPAQPREGSSGCDFEKPL